MDTGAEVNVISPKVCEQLCSVGLCKFTDNERIILRCGRASATTQEVEINTVKIDTEEIGPIICAVLDCGVYLILGVEVIRKRKAVIGSLIEALNTGRLQSTQVTSTSRFDSAKQFYRIEDLVTDPRSEILESEEDPSDTNSCQVTTSEPLRSQLMEVIKRHAEVFDKKLHPDGAHLPNNEEGMPIILNYHPKPVPPRRLSPAMQATVRETVRELLEAGVISPSESSYSSPVVLVRKKDGSWRFCVDYRALNKATVRMEYPLPNTQELLYRMRGSTRFCVLDLKSGFYQFPIDPTDRTKTAFGTSDGLFHFNRMSMGLTNSPGYFQRYMTLILNGLLGLICEIYIDDIIVYGNESTIANNLDQVLTRLNEYALRIRLEKCTFGESSVK